MQEMDDLKQWVRKRNEDVEKRVDDALASMQVRCLELWLEHRVGSSFMIKFAHNKPDMRCDQGVKREVAGLRAGIESIEAKLTEEHALEVSTWPGGP